MMPQTVTLYRPVGPAELKLIAETGFTSFPPRLPDQSIFYPVTNLEYAEEIASKWNVRESGQGYVTQFEVERDFLSRYAIQQVGNQQHREYWIPAGDLEEFNRHIIGKIEVVRSYPE